MEKDFCECGNVLPCPDCWEDTTVSKSGSNGVLSDADPHAVRWGLYKIMGGMGIEYTRWHWTTDANKTACGRHIKLFSEKCGTIFPETDEEIEKVDCKQCLRKLGR